MTREPANRSPLASLTATIRGCSAEAQQRLGADRRAGAARDVVEHHRQVGGVGDGGEVRDQPGLRRLVVVRRDDQQAVRARLCGRLGQLDGVRGVVGADAGDDAGPVADRLEHGPEQLGPSRRRVVVGDSPVVPLTTRPSLPWSTRWVARRCAASRSSAPSSSNGVTIAVSTRPNASAASAWSGMGTRYRRGHPRRFARQTEDRVAARSGVRAATRSTEYIGRLAPGVTGPAMLVFGTCSSTSISSTTC